MEAQTEKKALVAHAQGISFFSRFSKSLIPVGKGKPIQNPMGNVISTVRKIFTMRGNPIRLAWRSGKIKSESTISPAQSRKTSLILFFSCLARILLE
jgi:hypothetical protein